MIVYQELSDSALAFLLKDGDKLAYKEIFDRYNSLLYIHTYKKIHNREEAKDIVQDVFVSLWSKRQNFELKSNLAGYLYTCAHHKVLDIIAHQKIEHKYSDFLQHFISNSKNNADHLVREKQLAIIIENEIEMLPPKMREVFELSRKKHLSNKEIATHLNISEETVKSQVKNALKILRLKLGMLTFLFFLINF